MNHQPTDLPLASASPPAALAVQAARRRRNSWRSWLMAAAVLLLAAGAYLGWRHSAGSAAPDAGRAAGGGRRFAGNDVQPVSAQPAALHDINIRVNALGAIAAANTAVVRAQVSATLLQLHFHEGQQVQAGQLLATLDPRAFQAALGQAQGAQARDQAQLDNARVDLQRYEDLMAKDAIPRQQFDTQKALVRQLEGSVLLDKSAVETAQLQLSYCRVLAPISGRAGLKQVDLGNTVQASDANGIVSITQTRPVALVFSVPAALLPQINARLRAHQDLPVQAWDRDGLTRLALGHVLTIDNAIDATTDTIRVKALFPNADDALFPNQSISVRLQLDTLKDALSVPTAAVLRGAQGFYVYVVNADNTVSTRTVQPGAVDNDLTAVQGDLKAGEVVVIDGVDRLRNGARVQVIAADARQRGAAGAATAPASAAHHRRASSAPGAAAN